MDIDIITSLKIKVKSKLEETKILLFFEMLPV
jgi:hypothetical protein